MAYAQAVGGGEALSADMDALIELLTDTKAEEERLKRSKMVAFKREAAKAPGGMAVWSRELWIMSVESATVHRDKTVAFRFFNGVEVRV